MLTKLRIKNFQIHRDTTLKLCPGINVIIGESDNGKSSIVRALNWLIHNRPTGLSFRNHDATSKDEPVEVSLETVDEIHVSRTKNSSCNEYHLRARGAGGTFKALRTDVPSEVASELNLGVVNLQPQHATHFLLSESSGEVGRRFNELVGLDLIDDALKRVNSIATDAKRESASLALRVRRLEGDLSHYAKLDEHEAAATAIEKRLADLAIVQDDAAFLSAQTSKARQASEELKGLDSFNGASEKVAALEEVLAQYMDADKKARRLRGIMHSAKKIRTALDDYADWLTIEERTEEIEAAIKGVRTRQAACNRLQQGVTAADAAKCNVEAADSLLEASERKLAKLMQDVAVCPLCERPFERQS